MSRPFYGNSLADFREFSRSFWVFIVYHKHFHLFDELEAMELSKPAPKPAPKKRGRPWKNPVENRQLRPRGCPWKNLCLPCFYSTADWETYNQSLPKTSLVYTFSFTSSNSSDIRLAIITSDIRLNSSKSRIMREPKKKSSFTAGS